MGEPNEEDVKNVLYSLRLLGAIVDVHGDRATLYCVVSPEQSRRTAHLLRQGALDAEIAQLAAAATISATPGDLL